MHFIGVYVEKRALLRIVEARAGILYSHLQLHFLTEFFFSRILSLT